MEPEERRGRAGNTRFVRRIPMKIVSRLAAIGICTALIGVTLGSVAQAATHHRGRRHGMMRRHGLRRHAMTHHHGSAKSARK